MLRFIGQYTNGRETITYLDCTFEGHEPRKVSKEVADLLRDHPEFEEVTAKEVQAEAGEELTALRKEYNEVMGKKAFAGWDADTLREKMTERGE